MTDLQFNKAFVPLRLIIENVFGVLKIHWAILHEIFRHNEDKHNKVWYVLTALHNEDLCSGVLVLRDELFWEKWEKKRKKLNM